MTYHLNRKAGTLVNDEPTLTATNAANVYAGTVNYTLIGALNTLAGNSQPNYRTLTGVLNQLAGTTGLTAEDAASLIP